MFDLGDTLLINVFCFQVYAFCCQKKKIQKKIYLLLSVYVCLFGTWYGGGEVTGGSGSSISSWEFVATQNMNRSINLCIQRSPLSLIV